MQRITPALLLAPLTLLGPLAAQKVLLVDSTGNTGNYKTINAALKVATAKDVIRVVDNGGSYAESISLYGRAVTIQAAGRPVEVAGNLSIRSHPANARSKFSGVRFTKGLLVAQGKGDVQFDNCSFRGFSTVGPHKGTATFSSCHFSSDADLFGSAYVDALFFHKCQFQGAQNPLGQRYQCVAIEHSTVHFSRCSIRGGKGVCGSISCSSGSHALTLRSCRGWISGLQSDAIAGGDPGKFLQIYGLPGDGLTVVDSRVELSGVQLYAGRGWGGMALRQTKSWVTRSGTVTIPVLDTDRTFARGAVTNIQVTGIPNASSLTWIGLDYKPLVVPFGLAAIDLSQPTLSYFNKLDANGIARIAIDLRNLPVSFVAAPFAIQAVTLDSQTLRLSAPMIGIIGP